MKAVELRKLNKTELGTRLLKARLDLEELREKLAQKKLKNVKELRAVKKDIARILTIINE